MKINYLQSRELANCPFKCQLLQIQTVSKLKYTYAKTINTCPIFFITFSLSAQLRLNVDGNAKITGRLEIGTGLPAQNTFVGLDNGNAITSGTQNTFFGFGAGFFTNTGGSNTFLGPNAGRLNQAGSSNVYIGKSAGQQNNSGSQNTMIGSEAGANTTVSNNTFIGYSSGRFNQTGTFNTFIGLQAGEKNTAGQKNTFLGFFAGTNTQGSNNTFLGFQAGINNNLGVDNTFVGLNAGSDNSSGYRNTFLGMNAGFSSFSGYDNTFVGHSAGRSNITGNRNTFIGTNSGYFSNGDTCNTFVGHFSGFSNTNGVNNAFFGYQSGVSNTTGTNNTFYGFESGYSNSTGENNTFVGRSAGTGSQTGANNVFVGHVSGRDNNGGQENTYVGTFAAFSVVDGVQLTAFGYNAGTVACCNLTLQNSFAIGSNALMTQSNAGVLGNASMQNIGGYANWGTAADGRMKADVQEDVKGLDFVLQLHPVSYRMDAVKLDEFMRSETEAKAKDLSGKDTETATKKRAAAQAVYQKALEAKSRIRYTGFIAQEVEKAAAETDFEFSGIVKPANENDHYSLRYAEFVVPLVKAVQEQQELIEEQKNENTAQQEKIKALQKELIANSENQQQQISELRSLVEKLLAEKPDHTGGETYELELGQKAMLAQNHPNPFQQNTVVDYIVPEGIRNALIQVTSAEGKILGTVKIRQAGKGQVNIKTETYPAGTYFYSLVLDGQVFETKRMVLVR